METIHQIVRKAESNYLQGGTKLGKYVEWSMHDTIETIDAYLNSRHTSGLTDSLGREKPFFNIVTAAANIWYRATDLDRKDIRIIPDSSQDVALSFIATVLLQNWMKEARFGVFLNDWGRALARYGSAVVKFVEHDGKLRASVVPWNRFIADPIDFDAIPRIEKFYKTPEQLRQNPQYDQTQVDALLTAIETRKTLDHQQQDTDSGFVELYEAHGNLPTYMLQDAPKDVEPKDVKYRQQMHVVSYVKNEKGEIQDFTLYKGKEAKDPYMLTHLIKEDGRTLSIGAVEYLFDAQWMANHTMKAWKDQLDLASKLIFQTADKNFVGRNVLTAIETGDIMVHEIEKPLEPVNNAGHDVGNLQSFMQQWDRLGQEITSTPDAMRGITLPSATAYRQAALLTQASNSFFAMMTESKGLHCEDMLREYVIPFLKKQLNTKNEIVAILDDQGVSEIDAMYVPREAVRQYNAQFKKTLLSGNIPPAYNAATAEASVRSNLAQLGNKRFFKPDDVSEKTWMQALDGFEMRVNVEITDEASDTQAVLTTLSTVLQTIASNPAILQDPNGKMLFGKILAETGVVSPVQLSTPAPQTPAAPGADSGAPPTIPTTALPPNVLPARQRAAPLVGS